MNQEQIMRAGESINIQITLSDEQIERIALAIVDLISQRYNFQHNTKEILTPKEVEELLDISHTTRIEWTRQGVLKSYTLRGTRKYYKYSEIMADLIKVRL